MNKEEQLDYLAGFFDAEGCVTSNSTRGNRRLSFNVTQTTTAPLLLFQEMFGGSVRKVRNAEGNRNDCWRWERSCRHNDELAAVMQGRTAIKAYAVEVAEQFSALLYRSGGRRRTPEEVLKRQALLEMLARINAGEFDNHAITVEPKSDAYWAGLLDGDGMATVGRVGRAYRPMAAIFSAYRPILECAKQQFGGNIYQSYNHDRVNVWRVNGRLAIHFLERVVPFLVIKSCVSRRVIDVWTVLHSDRRSIPAGIGFTRKITNQSINRMNVLSAEIRELNRRGRVAS